MTPRSRIGAVVGAAAVVGGLLAVTGAVPLPGGDPSGEQEADGVRARPGASAWFGRDLAGQTEAPPAPGPSTVDPPSPGATSEPDRPTPTGFTLRDPRITESSGLALSRRHPHTVWTVNDSGDSARIFAVDTDTGETVGVHTLDADVRDVEALAVTDAGWVLVADIGDNGASRDSIRVHALREPDLGETSGEAAVWELTYPDGAHDAEALAVDPADGRVLIVTKGATGGVYALSVDAAADSMASGAHRLTKVGTVPARVTDAVFLPTGVLAVRTYTSLLLLDPRTYAVQAATLLPLQRQGETLALAPGAAGSDPSARTSAASATRPFLLVGSEGEGATVQVVQAPAGTVPAVPSPSPTS